MGHYMMNFMVYTLAMSGLICFALFVYKKVMNGGFCSKSSKFLEIEETMNVNPRKSLMIVRAGGERFLVASDLDRTSLISKLEDTQKPEKTSAFKYDFMRQNNPVQQENEDLDVIYPENKKEIHLELIKNNNPQSPRAHRRRNTNYMNAGHKTVTLDFDKIQNHGLPTMKEMAKKINEI